MMDRIHNRGGYESYRKNVSQRSALRYYLGLIVRWKQHSVREFAQLAFHYVGIELKWEGKDENEKGICSEGPEELIGKTLVEVSPDFYRPTDVVNLWGDPTKAKLNWNPNTTSFEDFVKIMVGGCTSTYSYIYAEYNIPKLDLCSI